MNLQGTITSLITPLRNQQLDEAGLIRNIQYQLKSGVDGILPLGTTGEAPTLSSEEQETIISIAVQEAKGKVAVVVGTGSHTTREAIEKTRRAQELGADAALVVTPYYNKPTQEGLFRHFEAIATTVELPLILYNIPGRCGINLDTSTIVRLFDFPTIIGIKECSGNMNQVEDIIQMSLEKRPDFKVFAGDDSLTLPMMALGAAGIISVVSNLVPDRVSHLVQALLQGDFGRARALHYELLPLYRAAFFETNPIPIKTAMNMLGMAAGDFRLPLCHMTDANRQKLRAALLEASLI